MRELFGRTILLEFWEGDMIFAILKEHKMFNLLSSTHVIKLLFLGDNLVSHLLPSFATLMMVLSITNSSANVHVSFVVHLYSKVSFIHSVTTVA